MSWDPFAHLAFPRDEEPRPEGSVVTGGEKAGRREALERVTQRLQREGVPRDQAREMSRQSMRRCERSGKLR